MEGRRDETEWKSIAGREKMMACRPFLREQARRTCCGVVWHLKALKITKGRSTDCSEKWVLLNGFHYRYHPH